jgi:hypothetical protein
MRPDSLIRKMNEVEAPKPDREYRVADPGGGERSMGRRHALEMAAAAATSRSTAP